MAQYGISGIWSDSNDVITDYSVHLITNNHLGNGKKMKKADAVALLEKRDNSAITVLWNYSTAEWTVGELVRVAGPSHNRFLKSDPDNKVTDNLGHLINLELVP